MNKFLTDETYLKQSGKAAGDYVKGNAGAMELILKNITL
jgi:3-deoxy-D-manno-octulosonic-acid transferase